MSAMVSSYRTYVCSWIAAEIGTVARFYDRLVYWRHEQEGSSALYDRLARLLTKLKFEDLGPEAALPDLSQEKTRRTAIVLNGIFDYCDDVEGLLASSRPRLARTTRLFIVLYNPYWRWLYSLCNRLGIRSGPVPNSFLTKVSLGHITQLTGFQLVRIRPIGYCPWRLWGFGDFLNKWLPVIPLLRWLSFANLVVLRPIIPEPEPTPTLSIIIPARNERGNIRPILERMPNFGTDTELIFVEGNSNDGTWEEIIRQTACHQGPHRIVTAQQSGIGKNDAVRLGFQLAGNDLVTILDADATVPPELIERFYSAYCKGLADFINGSRLVYTMEDSAMRFLNRLGNVFFAKALSVVLGTPLSDSLCGTKLMTKVDYERICRWRAEFGDFDPFGDFELLFGATELCLGLTDVPITYRARVYGSTNISRFRDGWLLLRMTFIGFSRIMTGRKFKPQ